MTELQRYAITHPKAKAAGMPRREFLPPWSLILTVNK